LKNVKLNVDSCYN